MLKKIILSYLLISALISVTCIDALSHKIYLKNGSVIETTNFWEEDGKIKECSKPVLRGITMNSTNKTYGTRFLLVGDCAGQVKPLTGGGIYYGLLSADIAVEVLKDAFRINDLSDKFLSLYERKWRILLDKEIKPAKYFRKIFSLFNNGQIDFAIDFIKRHNIDERLSSSEIGFDWHGAAIKRALCSRSLFRSEENNG